jgi:hypothetical protein
MRKFRLAVSILAIGAVIAAASGWMLVIDNPRKSDVIVVLAGETDRRPARGLQLLDQGFARHLILDVPADSQIYQWSQSQLAQKYIESLPQSGAISICAITGLSTRDEARDAAHCLQQTGGEDVLLVTSDFHTRRALNIFRHEVPGHNFSVAAASNPRDFGMQWWRHREWAKTAINEWTKFLWWELIDRWR